MVCSFVIQVFYIIHTADFIFSDYTTVVLYQNKETQHDDEIKVKTTK